MDVSGESESSDDSDDGMGARAFLPTHQKAKSQRAAQSSDHGSDSDENAETESEKEGATSPGRKAKNLKASFNGLGPLASSENGEGSGEAETLKARVYFPADVDDSPNHDKQEFWAVYRSASRCEGHGEHSIPGYAPAEDQMSLSPSKFCCMPKKLMPPSAARKLAREYSAIHFIPDQPNADEFRLDALEREGLNTCAMQDVHGMECDSIGSFNDLSCSSHRSHEAIKRQPFL